MILIVETILISGCIIGPTKNLVNTDTRVINDTGNNKLPICGNEIVEEGETSETCCKDVGCSENQVCENNTCIELTVAMPGRVGVANPSTVYCLILYPNQPSVFETCHYPDGTNCPMWDFYRGKCGQEWSYCKQHGYDMKDLTENEGWSNGGICIDKNGTEIGNVFDLMNLSEKVVGVMGAKI